MQEQRRWTFGSWRRLFFCGPRFFGPSIANSSKSQKRAKESRACLSLESTDSGSANAFAHQQLPEVGGAAVLDGLMIDHQHLVRSVRNQTVLAEIALEV